MSTNRLTWPDYVMISPYAEFVLNNRQKQSAHAQLDSWGAVGCYLSHVRCWEWILSQPSCVRSALILKDDACFDEKKFRSTWDLKVQPLRRQSYPAWDVLLLGFFETSGHVDTWIHDVNVRTLEPGGSFFGGHGYLVTRKGAAILREHAFPIEVHVDAFMLTLQQLGHLRLFLVGTIRRFIDDNEPSCILIKSSINVWETRKRASTIIFSITQAVGRWHQPHVPRVCSGLMQS